jgi:hypothetical protein
MPRKLTSKKKPAKKPAKARPRPSRAQAKPVVVLKNPMNPDASMWEIELTDIGRDEFLMLWNTDSDRIGFNLGEKAIYDKSRVVARIAKEIKLSQKDGSEEEE